MALVKIGYKYRCYPTEAQVVNLAQTFGCVRLIFNKVLDLRSTAWSERKENISTISSTYYLKEWKKDPELTFLNDVSAVPLLQSVHHAGDGYTRFFKGQAKYPKYKAKHRSRDAATYTSNAFKFEQLDDGTARVKLAKHDEELKIIFDRPLPPNAQPSRMTISRDRAGRYFISILVTEDIQLLPEADNDIIGLDMGLTHYIVDDQGNKVEAHKALAQYEKQLKRAQKDLSRKELGSKNREKARKKVARLHARVTDTRKDYLQKLSTMIIRENQIIIIETLAVKNMLKNKKLAKHISDAAWSTFVSMLEYKAAWYGRELIKVSQWEPTSQLCSNCGFKNSELTLADRYWDCPQCGITHDRDINAAINVKTAGLKIRSEGLVATAGLAGIACGADVSQEEIETAMVDTRIAVSCETGNLAERSRDRRL